MFTGVPDSLLKEFALYVNSNVKSSNHIIAANEGNAVGIACGHYFATQRIPLVYMQNSGLGNTINPLNSLANKEIWSIPILLLIGWRGEPNVHDEPQHKFQGRSTLELLDAINIPYKILSKSEDEARSIIEHANEHFKKASSPFAIVVKKNTFDKEVFVESIQSNQQKSLTRAIAMRTILKAIESKSDNQKCAFVATTGLISREIYQIRQEQSRVSRDILTVGGMGHASSIALGIVLSSKFDKVYCFDGDGSVLMHMGSLVTNATIKNLPANKTKLFHIVLNNNCHQSVGGQATPFNSAKASIHKIASASGYSKAWTIESNSTEQKLKEIVDEMENSSEISHLLEVKIEADQANCKLPGRPDKPPIYNVQEFIKYTKSL